jgi:hypothetical protein
VFCINIICNFFPFLFYFNKNLLLKFIKTRRILQAGKDYGLAINFHGEELSQLGSAEVTKFNLIIS